MNEHDPNEYQYQSDEQIKVWWFRGPVVSERHLDLSEPSVRNREQSMFVNRPDQTIFATAYGLFSSVSFWKEQHLSACAVPPELRPRMIATIATLKISHETGPGNPLQTRCGDRR